MFQRATAAAVPVIVVTLVVMSTIDSGSPVFARGGHGSGHHSGHVHHTSSHHQVNHFQSFVKNSHKNHSPANKHHKGHHRRFRHGYFGWDGGSDDGVDDGAAIDPVDADVAPTALPITLLNPAETGRPVNYTLGTGDYSVDAGKQMTHNDGTQVIAFDRGSNFGQASYTLMPGTYRFVQTAQGLDLRTVPPQVTAASTAVANVTAEE